MSTSVKIDRQNVEDLLNITPMQAGILFHYLTNQESGQYFEQLSLNVSGNVDFGIFMHAWKLVVGRNEMLRTVFAWEKIDQPVQIVLKRLEPTIRFHDFSEQANVKAAMAESLDIVRTASCAGDYGINRAQLCTEQALLVDEVREGELREGFDLRRGPLFRVALIKLDDENYEMIISNHHIIYDGWSNGIILQEFFTAYRELSAGREPILETKTRYKEYLQWLKAQDKGAEEKFWREYLQGFATKTPLPADYRFDGEMKKVDKLVCQIPHELAKSVEEIAKQLKVTFGAIFYTIWGMLLQKYNNLEEAVFGTTVSGRPGALRDVEKMVGLFINTLPLRVTATDNPTAGELISRVNEGMRERQPFEWTSLVDIKSYSELDSTEALFDSLVVVENYPLDRNLTDSGNLRINSYISREMTNFDLTLAVLLLDEIELQLHYNPERFHRETVERMLGHLINLLGQALSNVEAPVGRLSMLSVAERERVLVEFNATAVDYPLEQTVHQLFEKQVVLNPEGVAVVFGAEQLTYRELNERANELADRLRKKGVQPEQIVGLVLERSVEFVIGVLGILKAGGAYLPINPEYPDDRIEFMLADSGAQVVLTGKHLLPRLNFVGDIIDLTEKSNVFAPMDEISAARVDNLAYVIYTSGSTGKPKGVAVEHRALHNFLAAMYRQFEGDFGPGDNCLSLTNISFDVSVCEIFLPLTYGATLVLFDGEQVFDVRELVKVLIGRQITFTYIPPTLLKDVCESLKETNRALITLNKLLVGVEPIQDYILQDYLQINKELRIVNGYGPTEATICATFYKYETPEPTGKNIPIGKPLDNTQIYILDRYLQPKPLGVVGEVCIAGQGLARGYLHRPDLTAEKFVANPFNPGTLMYRTGDLARWLTDGNIEFVGRNDFQVKLRGFRIELGEIETELLRHPAVKEAVVLAREDAGGPKYLAAYLVLHEEVASGELRQYLQQSLPDYMVPAYFLRLERLPLTVNGKIDRKALPRPTGRMETGAMYVPPANPTEEKLVQIWSEILGVEKIGVEDNFFLLGGHSLKMTQLASRVLKEFERELPIKVIFAHPRIRELACYILGTQASVYDGITVAEERETYPLSPAQKRLYIVNQLEGTKVSYNMPGMLKVQGELDVARLEQAFRALTTRHDSLRTKFGFSSGLPFQKIEKTSAFSLEYRDFTGEGNLATGSGDVAEVYKHAKIRSQIEEFVRPFDLEAGRLLRVRVLQMADEEYALLFDMHHIISDGMSVGILIDEVTRLYRGEDLAPLKIQYKDFAVWQERVAPALLAEQEQYWLAYLAGELPVLNIIPDYPRPAVRDTHGGTLELIIERDLTGALGELARENNATLYMTLLAAYTVLLGKYTGQEDVIIGSPVAGRQHVDLERIIGMFVNMLAMRNYPERSKSFRAFLHEVRNNALEAFENQDYPFEMLVEKLGLERDLSRNPLFDTVFALQNIPLQEIVLPGLKFTPCEFEDKTAKFDLSLIATEENECIRCQLEYGTKLFKPETMARFSEHFLNLLRVVVTNPDLAIAEIDLLSLEERRWILGKFNDTRRDYPAEKTVVQLFQEQVHRSPKKIALVYGGESMAYGDMGQAVSRIAAELRTRGMGSGNIIGIMVEPSVEMFTGIFGILEAGAAYMPIDPDYPAGRIEYMLQDSQAKVLLTQRPLVEKVQFDGEVLFLDAMKARQNRAGQSDAQMGLVLSVPDDSLPAPDDLAYMIYTSGSTGKPKGVPIEHRSLLNLVCWHNEAVGLTADDASLKYAGFGFDASVVEIFPTLLVGGTVHIVNRDLRLDLVKLNEYMEANRVTTCFLPTPVAEQFMALENHSLRALITGGDKLKTYIKRPYKLFNDYGPTENTVVTTCAVVEMEAANIPIGRPIANTRVYVVDRDNQLQPIGVQGELCVAGIGLARGYWNRLDLTQEKFIPNPFEPGQRMYKTGDRARWLPDGTLEYLGRMDNQVKIRGYRIELGEIEQQLLQHFAVSEAAVTVYDTDHRKYILAYVVLAQEIEWADLRKELAEVLPDYMMPAHFIRLERLPLTANGKVDKRALPTPDLQLEAVEELVLPRTELEQKIAQLWAEVLGIEQVGVQDNFFVLGGNSLNAMQIVTLLQKECGLDVTLQDIFKAPTVETLALQLAERKHGGYADIPVLAKQENYELSYAQMRLWYIYQLNPTSIAYNMPGKIALQEIVDPALVEAVLQKLMERHESLRTYFTLVDGHPVQRIMQNAQLKLAFDDLTVEVVRRELQMIYAEVAEQPFDLEQGPLFRAHLVRVGAEEFELLFCLHHIISDGWSMMNLEREFWLFYRALQKGVEPAVQSLQVQYKDFASWQNRQLRDEAKLAIVKKYWQEQLGSGWPELPLPRDVADFTDDLHSAAYRMLIPDMVQGKLHELAREENTSLFMVLLAGFKAFLARLTGQSEIGIGIPSAGRLHENLHAVIGFFVNTLVLKTSVDFEEDFRSFLRRVQATTLQVLEYQIFPLELIFEELDIKYPTISAFFNMLNLQVDIEMQFAAPEPSHIEKVQANKFDLVCYVSEFANGIEILCHYRSAVFAPPTVEHLMSRYAKILEEIAENPGKMIKEYGQVQKKRKLNFNG